MTRRGALVALSCLVLIGGDALAAQPAQAAADNPVHGHPYRHGAVPTREAAQRMRAAASGANLFYGGAVDGIGVTTGSPKVYLIFWGSQWGTAGTDADGNTTLSGDPKGVAPRLQQLLKGIGTGNELWSGVTTQYCEGIPRNESTVDSARSCWAPPSPATPRRSSRPSPSEVDRSSSRSGT